MPKPRHADIDALAKAAPRFDEPAHDAKHAALKRLSRRALRADLALLRYHDLLLFLRAHPSDATLLAAVEAELARLAAFVRTQRGRHPDALHNHGLPYAATVTRFTHDCVRRLLEHPHARVALDACIDPGFDLNAVLRLTLPTLERGLTTAGLDNDGLLDALGVPLRRRLRFIVDQLALFDGQPAVKDTLFDALGLYVRLTPTHRRLSKAYNRLPMAAVFYQTTLQRDFDSLALMNRRLPAGRRLDAAGRAQAMRTLQDTLTLTCRETDTATYIDPRSLFVVDLERGLSVAIYGMVAARQLPLESYLGFTLFKNGLAVAYGGAWLLGPHANFGMNIFEPYRGGESGFLMCQVLRVYRQRFGVRFFEVDATQFGLDNPEGITSGAFWFYYRHGFRPLDVGLARRAEAERRRILTQPGYRCSDKTLIGFTASNMALNVGGPLPVRLHDLSERVALLMRRHGGDRTQAAAEATRRFIARAGPLGPLNAAEQAVLAEVALLASAMAIGEPERLALLRDMVRAKPVDVRRYQQLMLAFFGAG
jgi:hypothetical protein